MSKNRENSQFQRRIGAVSHIGMGKDVMRKHIRNLTAIVIAVLMITSCAARGNGQTGKSGSSGTEKASSSQAGSSDGSAESALSAASSDSSAASSGASGGGGTGGTQANGSTASSAQQQAAAQQAAAQQAAAQAPAWPDSGAVPHALSLPGLDGQNAVSNAAAVIDLSYQAYGIVKVRLAAAIPQRAKVGIVHDGSTYYYDLPSDGSTVTYPLQTGNGSYTITVYENVSGSSYASLLSTTASVSLNSSLDPFLLPSQQVNYSSGSQAAAIARQLVSGKTNNYERISAVLSYVAQHLSYDYSLAKTVQSGYVPNIDAVLAKGSGICYDYAAVSAAMLRSLGYPTKLEMGYVQNGTVYHAWNEVYISGSGWLKVMSVTLNTSNWSRVDVTFISTSDSSDSIASYIGSSSNYRTVYIY